jgi:biopolymer transport protein ExbD
MGKFRKKTKSGVTAISTASLPDIVFMLLFFFMVTTSMRQVNIKVMIKAPGASEVKKLEKKSLVSYIYIGRPVKAYQAVYGNEPRIQLNDNFATIGDIGDYITSERDKMNEADKPLMTTSIKVDENVHMGLVTDVKQELRKASALKINYSARKMKQVY